MPPTNIPSIPSALELYAQLNHLAAGFAGIFENNQINQYGKNNLVDLLSYNVPNNDPELPIMTYHNYVANIAAGSSDRFSINGAPPSMPNSSDLYDATSYCKSTYMPNPNITPSWNSDFYTYFEMAGDNYYTVLRIPELFGPNGQGNHPNAISTPIIFIAENVLAKQSYDGYAWDNINNTVIVIPALNDDIIDDHIDNHTAYIIVVGIEKLNDGTVPGRVSSSCEGGWDCADEFCDSKCGEPETCLDCQSVTNKKLYLFKVRIDDDVRTTKGGTLGKVIDNHFVDNLGGKYKLSLNSVVLHANGRWDAINNSEIRPKWKKNEVRRVVNRTNSTRSRGFNTWKVVWLNGDADEEQAGKGIKLSDNFNPRRAKIHISLAEKDDLFGKNRDIEELSINGIGIGNNQFWRSQGMPTLCGPPKDKFEHDDVNNPNPFLAINTYFEVTPSMWIDPNDPTQLLDEIEITALNVTFILRYEDY